MKNLINVLSLAFLMVLSLSSCRNDAEIPSSGSVTHPQEDCKGVYMGEWSRQLVGEENFITASGTITFTPSTENYITDVNVKCQDLNLDLTSKANIAPGAEGYIFYNSLKDNGFGTIFSGKIDKADMRVNIQFKLSVKEGRKVYTYIYKFNGNRN